MTTRVRSSRLSETAFQQQVTELAERLGWSWMHAERVVTRRTDRSGAERFVNETPLRGPLGKGWPDLVLVRERIVFAELKSASGRLTPEQRVVVGTEDDEGLLEVAGAEVHVWAPADFDEVVATLTRRRAA